MSGTHRAADPQPQPAGYDDGRGTPVPEVPAAYGADGRSAGLEHIGPDHNGPDPVGLDPIGPEPIGPVDWDPAAEQPRPVSQRSPLGSQAEGMAAIRAVWERAAESERRRPARPGRPQRRREPKRLGPALLGVLVCACLLMFFAWAAAPALWISIGHADRGTVAVTSCQEGFAPACTGVFTADSGWSKPLSITGEAAAADVGTELAARATGPGAHSAYVGGTAGLLLRWAPALVLFMVAAFALVAVSGATRLYDGRSAAVGLCWAFAGAVLAAALAFAW
ncbi:hypothetical protein SAMN05216298_3791 [Glycomyces sambucus]|uniref:Uncharacterized protein n=1 Tax=Glycomyces sambucus TaxID=380244 RepID=A0A1G9JQS0_9ACTN|nr:hypothetical protein [Glycomyces sambucus]SDL39484.1 hypothetical protein SAMN05216298_3791 [Glycomyces sambucus]